MTDGDEPVTAGWFTVTRPLKNGGEVTEPENLIGLTKREFFAALMLLARSVHPHNPPQVEAEIAVTIADALIDELNKEERGKLKEKT